VVSGAYFTGQSIFAVYDISLPGSPICWAIRIIALPNAFWPCVLILCPAGHLVGQLVIFSPPASFGPCLLLLCPTNHCVGHFGWCRCPIALAVSATPLSGNPFVVPSLHSCAAWPYLILLRPSRHFAGQFCLPRPMSIARVCYCFARHGFCCLARLTMLPKSHWPCLAFFGPINHIPENSVYCVAQFVLAVSAIVLPVIPLCCPSRCTSLPSAAWLCLILLCLANNFGAGFALSRCPIRYGCIWYLFPVHATLLPNSLYFATQCMLAVFATPLHAKPLRWPLDACQ